MSTLSFCVVAVLASLPLNAYCQDNPAGEKRWGQGSRAGEARGASPRATREGKPGEMPAMAEHNHGHVALANTAAGSRERAGGMDRGMRDGGVVWLSDSPPMRGGGSRPGGMAGMDMGGERGGPRVKRLWLRSGADPQKSAYAREDAEASVEILLVSPRSKPEGELLPPPVEGGKGLSFAMPDQGFYRLYVTTRKLQGDTLNVGVAKAEVGNFGHDGDAEEQRRAMTAPRVLENAAIEIVCERQDQEGPFSQTRSGANLTFIVLQKGLPLANARVRFVSHQGWVKEVASDEQGRASFQVIRDYFPPWGEFQKRFKSSYLVIAEASAAGAGSYKGQPYGSVRQQATLAGSYYTSPDDYRSYAWGLGAALFAALFSGIAIYFYRRRRLKPFQEVHLNEKA